MLIESIAGKAGGFGGYFPDATPFCDVKGEDGGIGNLCDVFGKEMVKAGYQRTGIL